MHPLQTPESGTAASTLNAASESSVNPNNSPPLQSLASAPVLPQEIPAISESVTQAEAFASTPSPSHSQDGDITITEKPPIANDPNPFPGKPAEPQVDGSDIAKESVNGDDITLNSVTQ